MRLLGAGRLPSRSLENSFAMVMQTTEVGNLDHPSPGSAHARAADWIRGPVQTKAPLMRGFLLAPNGGGHLP